MAVIEKQEPKGLWKAFFRSKADSDTENLHKKPKWNMGMLNDKETIEVPVSRRDLKKEGANGFANTLCRLRPASLPGSK